MKVCGVDLKGNEAIVSLVSLADGLFHLPDCRTRRLTLADTSAKGLKSFQSTFAKLVEDYKIDAVIIRQRQSKGKFAGSAIGFKLEVFQFLGPELSVHSTRIQGGRDLFFTMPSIILANCHVMIRI